MAELYGSAEAHPGLDWVGKENTLGYLLHYLDIAGAKLA